jgi:hypothetical protein
VDRKQAAEVVKEQKQAVNVVVKPKETVDLPVAVKEKPKAEKNVVVPVDVPKGGNNKEAEKIVVVPVEVPKGGNNKEAENIVVVPEKKEAPVPQHNALLREIEERGKKRAEEEKRKASAALVVHVAAAVPEPVSPSKLPTLTPEQADDVEERRKKLRKQLENEEDDGDWAPEDFY